MMRYGLSIAAGLCLALSSAMAADEPKKDAPAGPVSYFKEVRPILQTNCQGCHQPAKRGGEYLMTDFEKMLAGGESKNKAVIAGDPVKSHLIEQITPGKDGKAAMPQNKPPLSEAERNTIARWIKEGAKNDTPASAANKYDMEHPPEYAIAPIITSVAYSNDGQFLAISAYHEVIVYKADASEIFARLVGLSERIEKVTFSPDSKLLAVAGGSPGRMGEIQIWEVAAKKLKLSIPVTYDTVYGVSWSPDQKFVSVGLPDNSIRAFDATSGLQVLFNGAHADWVRDTVFSVDGSHIVSVSHDRAMKLVEVATQRFIDNITSITPGALKGGLNAVDRHPKKDELLCGGADGTPKIYKMIRTQARQIGDDFNLLRAFPALPGRIFDCCFSRDGGKIVAGSSLNGVGEIRVYNADNAQQIAKMEEVGGAVYAVDFSHDGTKVASGGYDGYLRIYDAATGKVVKKFFPVPLKESPK